MKQKIFALYILLAGAFWGSSCLFVNKLTSMGFSPIHCTAIRVICGALILNAVLLFKGRGLKLYRIDLPSWGLAAASGIGSVLAMCLFYYYCMTETSAAVSAILLYTAPVFVMIMSVLFFKEKITVRKVAAFAVAITGCALVSGIAGGAAVSLKGLLFGVLSGLAYSLYGILTTFYMKRNQERLTFSALNFTFASLGVVWLLDVAELKTVMAAAAPLPTLLGLFVLFSLCTAVLPYVLYTKGLAGVRPDVASILAFVEPLTAALLGICVLKQPFSPLQGVGIGLVIAALAILQLPPKKRKT